MYGNDPLKCLTGEVRLSYANLDKPRAPQGGQGDPKYSVTLLIPKTDTTTITDFRNAIKAAAQDGVSKLWGGVCPPNLDSIIHDGDGVRPNGMRFGDECHNCWVITASSKNKPQVVGQDNINVALAPQDIYSGMYARVTVRFYPFNTAGKRGVGCGLGNVMKTRDGEPLSGGASAAADFAGVGNSVAPTATATPMQQGQAQAYPQATPPWNSGTGMGSMQGFDAAPVYPSNINPLTGQPM